MCTLLCWPCLWVILHINIVEWWPHKQLTAEIQVANEITMSDLEDLYGLDNAASSRITISAYVKHAPLYWTERSKLVPARTRLGIDWSYSLIRHNVYSNNYSHIIAEPPRQSNFVVTTINGPPCLSISTRWQCIKGQHC